LNTAQERDLLMIRRPQLRKDHPLAGHQLLLPCNRADSLDLFLVDPATGDARNLTCNGAMNRYPAWSPDGKRIVFTSDLRGVHDVYVMSAAGGRLRQLTEESPSTHNFLPTWGPDNKIAFGRDIDGRVEIVTMNDDGSDERVVAPGTDPCLSPDGRHIAFTKKVGGGYCLFKMGANGRGVRQLTTHENQIGAVTPSWSPDGRKILFVDQVGEALEIFVCLAASGRVTQLTHLGKISTSPAWSPDGKWISFRVTDTPFWRDPATYAAAQERRDTLRPVWIMGADGEAPRPIDALRYQCATDGSRAAWRPR